MEQASLFGGQAPLISGQWSVLTPTLQPRPNFYLPPEFSDIAILHIIKNNLSKLRPPLILAIQGPTGEGKSEQARELCSRLGIYVIALSGSTISGIHEKEPVLILREAYLEASAIRSRKGLAVVLIDDLDTSVVSVHEDRRYTVNSQLVSGALMNLADDPLHIGERQTHRIPIIVTGNDFTHLYEPLTRHGRVWFFDWKPSIQLKTQIVRHLFEGHIPQGELERIGALVNHFSDEPIAFFHQLRNDLYDSLILETIDRQGKIDIGYLDRLVSSNHRGITVKELVEIGGRKRDNRPRNFVDKVPSKGASHVATIS